MNPWLRDLARTLAAVAVEEALAREQRQGSTALSGDPPRAPRQTSGAPMDQHGADPVEEAG